MGWVRAIAVDPGNQWFATGAGDRVVKVSPSALGYWSLADSVDMGLGIGRVEALVDGSHLDDPRSGRLGPTSIPVLVCRG